MPIPKRRRDGSARPPKRPRPRSSSWKSAIPLVLAVVLGTGIGTAWWKLGRVSVATDTTTLCRTDEPPPSVTAVLLDVTDGLSPLERLQVEHEVERARKDMPVFGQLVLYTLGEAGHTDAAVQLVLCNPGDGSNMSALYQNPQHARERWERDFRDRLAEALASVATTDEAAQSPLMESVKAIALKTFGSPQLDRSHKRLLVVSDLLQHSSLFSHYGAKSPTFEAFAASPGYVSVRTDLRSVEVQLVYIRRPGTAARQGKAHLEFWLAFLRQAGADMSKVTNISGDA
jgi:hypothetical protein